jgi:death-on-curing protein
MTEPTWVRRDVLELLHSQTIAEHGGADGLRDEGLLESALARPQNLCHYENVSDVARLAACYGFGLAKNHAFVDGNKRIAFIAVGVFLRLNGYRLTADQAQATLVMLSVAAGSFSEDALADWLRKNIAAL